MTKIIQVVQGPDIEQPLLTLYSRLLTMCNKVKKPNLINEEMKRQIVSQKPLNLVISTYLILYS